MSDDELMLALSRECDWHSTQGRTLQANEGRRILEGFRNAVYEHRVAEREVVIEEAGRWSQWTDARELNAVILNLVKAVVRGWRVVINDSRAQARRFVTAGA